VTGPACVLMVEDEMCLAMLLEDQLSDAGYRVLRSARLAEALALADREHIDAAVLDVNLGGQAVFPLAERLRAQGVPMVFASGYGEPGIPAEYRDCPVLQKPYPPDGVVRAVAALLTPPRSVA